MADSNGVGRFIWFDLATVEPDAAGKFYARLFGWRSEPKGDVTVLHSPAGAVGALGVLPPDQSTGYWLPYIAVADITAASAKAQQLGASVTRPATATGTGGQYAHLVDPTGAAFGLYSPADAPYVEPAVGTFSWVELMTADAPAAASFYFALCGWTETGSVDMGPTGQYRMFGVDGKAYGGIYNPGQLPMGPQWLSYVRVPDVASATATAKSVGARVINGPMEVPGGDWIVQFLDPQGVLFAAHEVSAKVAPVAKAAPKPAAKPAAKSAAPKAPVKVKAKVKTEAKTKAKAKTKPKAKTRLKPKAKTKAKSKAKSKAKFRAKPRPKARPKLKARLKTALSKAKKSVVKLKRRVLGKPKPRAVARRKK